MELDTTRRSSGVAKAGLTTGIIGTGLATLGILGGGSALLGGLGRNNTSASQAAMDVIALESLAGAGWGRSSGGWPGWGCGESAPVTRYDAAKDARIAELETQVALRDSNTYTDQKNLEMYRYIDGRLREIEGQIAQQAVVNQATSDRIQLERQERECCCARMEQALATETAERRCADNTLVNYMNATFYPKMIADITTGTTTTAQALFNPLPCDCCGGN